MINGQKVWTSLAQFSDRCVLLTRTGPVDSRHRGITAFFVDMDTPGITVKPLEMLNGEREFAEVFFDDVVVPAERMLGELNGGWAVAMSILPYERSSCFWQRIAFLYRRLERLVEVVPADDRAAEIVGEAYVQFHALRARSRDLRRNAPLATVALNTIVTSAVGTGLTPRARIDRELLGLTEEEAGWLLKDVLSDRLFENGMICRLDDRAEPFVQIAPPLVAGIDLFEEITEILRDGLTHAAEQLESGVPA